jgi:hypothetical protein
MVPMTAMESKKAAVMRLHSRLPHSNLFIQSNPQALPQKDFPAGFFCHQNLTGKRIKCMNLSKFHRRIYTEGKTPIEHLPRGGPLFWRLLAADILRSKQKGGGGS